MADRRRVRKTSRYAPYTASMSRNPYESRDRDECDSSKSELTREYERVSELVRDCDETILAETEQPSTANVTRRSQVSENSGEDEIDPSSVSSTSSSTRRPQRSTTTESSTSSNQEENIVPQLEDSSEYVNDEAYFSADFSNVFDDSPNASDIEQRQHRAYDVVG